MEYIKAGCENDPNGNLLTLFRKGIKSEYSTSDSPKRVSKAPTSEDKRFVIALNKIIPVPGECALKNTSPKIRKLFASRFDKLEIECGKKCEGKGWFKVFSEKELEILGKEMEPMIKKCKK